MVDRSQREVAAGVGSCRRAAAGNRSAADRIAVGVMTGIVSVTALGVAPS